MNILTDFHFIRPAWLLLILPLCVLLYLLYQQKQRSRSWQKVVDAKLLAHLLIGVQSDKRQYHTLWLLGCAGLLSALALAGPTWEKQQQPVFRQQSGMVIALDLSRSMDAQDIRPSRLARARLKLIDILKLRREGQTALISYAAQSYVVTPLTNDNKNIISQLSSMSSDIMPAQGSRPDLALAQARQLLQQAGVTHGSVLLITDGIDGAESLPDEVKRLVEQGHQLLILGVGSTAGAPIPNEQKGGFVSDRNGNIVMPKLDETALAATAQQGHGSYRTLSSDDSDIEALLQAADAHNQQQSVKVQQMRSDEWQDAGVWLVLPLLLLAALSFRRGYLACLICVALTLPQPRIAQAFEWSELWRNSNQRAQQALQQGDAAKAAQLFTQPDWRAAAHYRAGEYDKAASLLQANDSADAHYNRGNALAKLGKYPEAIQAYDAALKHAPNMQDAKDNRELLKKLLEQQKQEQQKQEQQKQDQQKQQQQQSAAEQQAKQNKQDQQPAEQAKQQPRPNDGKPNAPQPAEQTAKTEKQQADERWLQRIPDDPGGLWRRKFLYQYQKQQHTQEEKAW